MVEIRYRIEFMHLCIFSFFFKIKLTYLDDNGKDELGSLFGFAFKGLNYQGPKSIPNLEVTVDCTLNELYTGCSKDVTYTRIVLNGDGQTTRNIQETK